MLRQPLRTGKERLDPVSWRILEKGVKSQGETEWSRSADHGTGSIFRGLSLPLVPDAAVSGCRFASGAGDAVCAGCLTRTP